MKLIAVLVLRRLRCSLGQPLGRAWHSTGRRPGGPDHTCTHRAVARGSKGCREQLSRDRNDHHQAVYLRGPAGVCAEELGKSNLGFQGSSVCAGTASQSPSEVLEHSTHGVKCPASPTGASMSVTPKAMPVAALGPLCILGLSVDSAS